MNVKENDTKSLFYSKVKDKNKLLRSILLYLLNKSFLIVVKFESNIAQIVVYQCLTTCFYKYMSSVRICYGHGTDWTD